MQGCIFDLAVGYVIITNANRWRRRAWNVIIQQWILEVIRARRMHGFNETLSVARQSRFSLKNALRRLEDEDMVTLASEKWTGSE
jgi:hypothetical protein